MRPAAKRAGRSAVRTSRVLALLRSTLACPTAPLREGAVIAHLLDFVAARRWLAVRVDEDGNVEIRRRGVRASRSPLVLAAHMDHPGFHAVACVAEGRHFSVEARLLGGVPIEALRRSPVRFFAGGDEIPAQVLGARRDAPGEDPRVRLRAAAPVRPGAFGMFDLPAFRRRSGDPDLVETRAADDLAGVAAALALLDVVDQADPARRVDVRGVFTRAEEIGFVGALAFAARGRLPRHAHVLSLEASRALPDAPQGAGPILRVGDRTSVFDDALTRWIARTAAAEGSALGWQRRLMDGGTCEATAYQALGHRCAALCVALGNYHNVTPAGGIGAESIRLSDLVGLVRWLEALVRRDHDRPRGGVRDPLRVALAARDRRGELARDPFA